ncbi:adhesion G protein-coupled receptor E5 isoform X3 [Phyllostomus hastatus]|uniref:adhesion G protein-coupled receptor E5 isoform X3 n=1 Tax=Phyllostomus hastatus TaxID=9423 RepID=UPI001E682B48|nr:adhesion G protein-coupled receptor E5 isoform X3 [Phyllostomus hastatus]
MGGPRFSVFLVLRALWILLVLWEDRLRNTSVSASMACAPWCPRHSTCVNATTCRCLPGFSSSSAEITDPTETCDDINECRPPSPVSCGKLAECKNTEGSYYCMCTSGYRLVSGALNFSHESQNTCQDIDECHLDPGICKSRHICINAQGSYTCRCPPGLEANPEDPKLCRDVDECTSGQNPCHNSTICINVQGSYKCRCRDGWKPVPGSPNGPNTVCEDVDECSSREHQCHNSTFCINTPGSYVCHCLPGWVSKPGFLNKQRTTQCEEISFPTWTPPPGIKSQSLSRFFEKVQDLGRYFKTASAKDTIKNVIKALDELLEVSGDLEALILPDRHRVATYLLLYLEEVLRTLTKIIPEPSFTYHSRLDTELSLVIQEQGNGTITLGQSHARMQLNWAEAVDIGEPGPTLAGLFSSRNMQRLLANASLELDPEKKAQLESAHGGPVGGGQPRLLSAVNTVFLSNKNTEKLGSPVNFSFSHPEEKPRSRQELICAFWKGDSDSGGYWATTGCWKVGSKNGSTTCRCRHLSSFAVLMAHYDVEDLKLTLITQVGLALSLVCLLLCILTFLLVRPIQGSRTTVHLHLCICLFLGSAIFLAGIENKGGQVGPSCRLVAGLLHYCFLAAFCWMSLEGLELYFLVVRVFQGQGLSKHWLYLIGYGIPGLIVAISAAAYHDGYGRENFCWLKTHRGFVWSFNGPVAFIILCNAVIFVTTVWKLTQKFSEINPDMNKLKKARVLTITAIAQLFVLGCTWASGLFLFQQGSYSHVLAYIFTILNCFQGLFLFLLHCLLNKKVREEYWKWACMVTGNKYSDFTTSTSSSNHNQTKVLRTSESGM